MVDCEEPELPSNTVHLKRHSEQWLPFLYESTHACLWSSSHLLHAAMGLLLVAEPILLSAHPMPRAYNYKEQLCFWSTPLSVHLKTNGQLQGKAEGEGEKKKISEQGDDDKHWTGQHPATEEPFLAKLLFCCCDCHGASMKTVQFKSFVQMTKSFAHSLSSGIIWDHVHTLWFMHFFKLNFLIRVLKNKTTVERKKVFRHLSNVVQSEMLWWYICRKNLMCRARLRVANCHSEK